MIHYRLTLRNCRVHGNLISIGLISEFYKLYSAYLIFHLEFLNAYCFDMSQWRSVTSSTGYSIH